jgi:hypothetical protein
MTQQSGRAGRSPEHILHHATDADLDLNLSRQFVIEALQKPQGQFPLCPVTNLSLATAVQQAAKASVVHTDTTQAKIEQTEIQHNVGSQTTEDNGSVQVPPAKKLRLSHSPPFITNKDGIEPSHPAASFRDAGANSNTNLSDDIKHGLLKKAAELFSDDEETILRDRFFACLKLDDPRIRRLTNVNIIQEATSSLGSSPTKIQESRNSRFDLIATLSGTTELIVEVCRHLPPRDIVKLFSISRAFNAAISASLLSSIRTWISAMAPTSGRIFPFKLYASTCIPDPTGRSVDFATSGFDMPLEGTAATVSSGSNTRLVPSMSWFQMVASRERRVRDILAVLARSGHRTPPTMHITLKKVWFMLDCPTNAGRVAMIRNEVLWTKFDLYNAQLFFIKLQMCFNDPVYGPESSTLLNLMLGQKSGLFPLWQLLRRKKFHVNAIETVQAKVRYDYAMTPEQANLGQSIFGIPFEEVGIGHREGWGAGTRHLARPNELVPMEAVRRQIALDCHIMDMMMWGHVDCRTGENLVPSEEELYMSDSEGEEVPFRENEDWLPRHARKKRWETLTREEKKQVLAEEENEKLMALAWGDKDANTDGSSSGTQDGDSGDESDDDDALKALASQYYSEEELNADWSEYLAMIETDGGAATEVFGEEQEPKLKRSSYEFMEY